MNRFGDIDCSFRKLPPIYGFHSQELVSLEQALRPIESEIKDLSRYIKIAKKHCRFPNEHALSKDQSASIYIYTMEWGETTLYRILNEALRAENRHALKIWFPYLKLFDTALDLLPTVKESVWRGIPIDIGKNYTKNQVFTWWSINSCSSSVNVIKNFLGQQDKATLFLIEVVSGKKISGYTEFENEDEIILKMGTEFRVKSDVLEQSNGSFIVHLIEMNDDDDNDEQPPVLPMKHLNIVLKSNLKWRQNAATIAGGNGKGDQLNRLFIPEDIYVDDKQNAIYIADKWNHRIVKWKFGENKGQIVAGAKGEGWKIDQLSKPIGVIVDRRTTSLIISDSGNERIVRYSLENQLDKEILISDVACFGLMMNDNGDLFVADSKRNEVKRWRNGEKQGIIVAGGNGEGDRLNQLNLPTYIFIDQDDAVYVSDSGNNRVMKWLKGANEGIIVAGGRGQGSSFNQLSDPGGLIVNEMGDVYVADSLNHRIMCWSVGAKEGRLIVGGNGYGHGVNQLNCPTGLAFDVEQNLYIADRQNNRIQRFDIDNN